MRYLSVAEIAKKWDVSERSVRNYCAQGRVNGAFLTGKTWNIPKNAEKPERTNKRKDKPTTLLDILKEQKASKCSGVVIVEVHMDGAVGNALDLLHRLVEGADDGLVIVAVFDLIWLR